MDTKAISDCGYLFYDPFLYGCDDDIFKVYTGSARAVDGKIRINADGGASAVVNTTTLMMYGNVTYNLTIPTAPTSGDSRIFGLYSRAYGSRNAAYFFISGTNFYARSYGPHVATYDTTTIPWSSSWTNEPIKYEIRWSVDKVVFVVNGTIVATHSDYIPKQTLLPTYFVNNRSDIMELNYWEISNARKMFWAKPLFYSSSASLSPSISASISPSLSPSISPSISPSESPSTSISPSISPSESPSTSISPSLSPSLSDSISPSLSSSISDSISPSESPSTSISPSLSSSISDSISPSESPSTSISPSISPSLSSSISTSISPSESPSTSISPSLSSSISASISPSISSSNSPSSSISPSLSPSAAPS